MPTTRPRHTITETDELARLLDDAARRWPGESRARLLVLLAGEGHHAHEAEVERRRAAIERHAGAFTGMYPTGYLEELRKDWPD